MKQKALSLLLFSLIAMVVSEANSISAVISPGRAQVQLALDLAFEKGKIQGGERLRVRVTRSGDTSSPMTVILESTQPNLIPRPKDEVIINRGESSVTVDLITLPTPIKTTVGIKVFRPGALVPMTRSIDVYPALLKSVTLSRSSMTGTLGAKIDCRVELNSAAPNGGIEIYLSKLIDVPLELPSLSLDLSNPRIAAGSNQTTFAITYERIRLESQSVASGSVVGEVRRSNEFNFATRRLAMQVGLEPASRSSDLQTTPGLTSRIEFEVIPLKVASLTVQPNSIVGGGESLASFSLNFPPGPNEVVKLMPASEQTAGKAWTQRLGSSCQAQGLDSIDLPLTQGTTSYSFKVCTADVTANTTGTVTVYMRSGSSSAQITIRP